MESRQNKIENIQKNMEQIRNVCIIAHIDHGKTSLTDSLLCSNKIITKNLAGKLRFMDDRVDEQEREITMKSSTCALISDFKENNYLLNIIDTPGHIDFSFEVSSALRVSEGAILVVDILEGVLTQTYNVLKKAIDYNLKIILVFNKIDKFFTILKLNNEEIEEILFNLLNNINEIIYSLISQKVKKLLENMNLDPDNKEFIKEEEELLKYYNAENYFDPIKNNVIFASSIDNFGFTLENFAEIYSKKLKIDKKDLIKGLWGYKYLTKSLKITETAPNISSKTIFNSIILSNLSAIYKAIEEKNENKIENICKILKIEVNKNNIKLLIKENKSLSSKILQNWLPLYDSLFKVIYNNIDNPLNSQLLKNEVLLDFGNANEENILEIENIITEKKEIFGFITKVLRINKKFIHNSKYNFNKDFLFFGLSKLISGVIREGDEIHIKYKINDEQNIYKTIKMKIEELYYWQGNSLISINEVHSGNIFGFRIDNMDFKRATFSSLDNFPNLIIESEEKNLLKVKISPKIMKDYDNLLNSLNILNQVDPVAKMFTNEKGQFILETQGEIHLERCIKDIIDNFENLEVEISKPIINFKEQVSKNKLILKKRNYKNFDIAYEKEFILKKISEDNEIKEEEEEIIEDKKEEKIENKDNENWEVKNKFYSESSFYSDSEDERKAKELKENIENSITSKEEISYNEDSKFIFKESDFLYKDQKENKKEVNKKYNTLKLNKYDLEKINKKSNFKEILINNRKLAVGVQIISIGKTISEWLENYEIEMKKIFNLKISKKTEIDNFFKKFLNILNENLDKKLVNLIKRCLISFGPKKYQNNILLNLLSKKKDNLFFKFNYKVDLSNKTEKMLSSFRNHYFKNNDILNNLNYQEISNIIELAFDSFINNGPLCNEPLYGNIIIVEYIREIKNKNLYNNTELDLKIQIQNAFKIGFKEAFLGGQPKIVQPIYLGTAFLSNFNQSSYFEIVKKRRGKIISSDYNQQLDLLNTEITLPLIESHGFYSEIMKVTSGNVIPQLKFFKYEIIEEDPFFEPLTKEELEDNGEDYKNQNYAKNLLLNIRERKGFLTDKKIIEDANKQLNLTK